MALSLATSLRHGITLTPRMQHAIRVLQLSAVDVELALRNAVVTNPFLEETEEGPAVVGEGPASDLTLAAPASDELALEDHGTQAEIAREQPLADHHSENFVFDDAPRGARASFDDASLSWIREAQGLRDHLRAQLYASRVSEREMLAAQIVIETLDESGFLRDGLESCLAQVEVEPALSEAELESALALVRTFDPTGVGARSLQECLLLQLEAHPPETAGRALAREILGTHLDLLAKRDYPALRKALGCEESSVREALSLIRKLDPDPGSRFSTAMPQYIVPDVVVRESHGRYVALLNPSVRCSARLNHRYVELFQASRGGANPEMNEQLTLARWMIRSVEQRFDTILRVANFIVSRQQAYFYEGDRALVPLSLRDVSTQLGLHESTVSRASNNKFMSTPRGCVEFRHFFTGELARLQGPPCSRASVRDQIHELIKAEPPGKPLSDVQLAAHLKQQGIKIARRTVTKYRAMLKVPAVEFRRLAN